MAAVKARKGDFVAWNDSFRVTYTGGHDGPREVVQWKLGIVHSATRDGVVKTAVQLGHTGAVALKVGQERRISNAKTLDLEGLTAAYRARLQPGSWNPPKTIDEVRELVRPYLIGAEVAR